jgi:hypothetical protein
MRESQDENRKVGKKLLNALPYKDSWFEKTKSYQMNISFKLNLKLQKFIFSDR